jgi:glycosyltransferase involved in cell wall biosynthesis
MRPIRILVDSFADGDLINAQMCNAREIISRLDPQTFQVSTFVLGKPDPRLLARRNTRLVQLPQRRQTVRILYEFLLGSHELLFYLKASPASRCYLSLRNRWRDRRMIIGTIESQCDLRGASDIAPEAVRLWEQTILRSDRLYSNSVFVQRSLREQYGLSSDVIPTGADTRFFTPKWERTSNLRPQVLFVGSLWTRKHPEVVVSAAARFPGADFRIVGEGPLRETIAAQAAAQGLRNVTLTGPLARHQVRDEFRGADIFFFPSSFEGSPKVIVEAAASGLPVICRSCYSPETVLHGESGFLAESEDEMYSYLSVLLQNEGLRTRMGRAGRQHSLKFDWDLIAAAWANTFVDLSDSRTLRRAS